MQIAPFEKPRTHMGSPGVKAPEDYGSTDSPEPSEPAKLARHSLLGASTSPRQEDTTEASVPQEAHATVRSNPSVPWMPK